MGRNAWGQGKDVGEKIQPAKPITEEMKESINKQKVELSLLKKQIIETNIKKTKIEEELKLASIEKDKQLVAETQKLEDEKRIFNQKVTEYEKKSNELIEYEKKLNDQEKYNLACIEKFNSNKEKIQEDFRIEGININNRINDLAEREAEFNKKKVTLEKQSHVNSLILKKSEVKLAEAIEKENIVKRIEEKIEEDRQFVETQMNLKDGQEMSLSKKIAQNKQLQKNAEIALAELEEQKRLLLERETRIITNKKNQDEREKKLKEKEEHLEDWEIALKHDAVDLEKRREILKKKARG